MKRNTLTLIACMVSVTAFLTACNENEPVITTHSVEAVTFDVSTEIGSRTAHIETDTEVLVAPISRIDFVTIDSGEPLAVDVTSQEKSQQTPYEMLFGYAPDYTLYIPNDQLKEISQRYAKAYQETLEHTAYAH